MHYDVRIFVLQLTPFLDLNNLCTVKNFALLETRCFAYGKEFRLHNWWSVNVKNAINFVYFRNNKGANAGSLSNFLAVLAQEPEAWTSPHDQLIPA